MKNQKQVLLNQVLTGLLVAASFAAVVPMDVFAQSNLAGVGTAANANILTPFVQFSSYIAYGVGTVMTIAGIAGCKKHSDSPTNNPLAPALGRLGAGAAFLAAPGVASMLAGTSSATSLTGNTATFQTIGGF